MGRPARKRDHRRDVRPARVRPEGENDDGLPTIRNIIPWRAMEKELAKKLAAKAARGEIPDLQQGEPREREDDAHPDSGVRRQAFVEIPNDDPHRPLSYSVYTVSELDEARAPVHVPGATPVVAKALPSQWTDVRRSAVEALRVWLGWARSPKPRPRMMDICGIPLAAFIADLRSVVRRWPWQRIGWAAACVGGAAVLLLFAVVTVAELTDDLKPTRATNALQTIELPDTPSAALAVVTPSPDTIELDDEPVAKAKGTKAAKPKVSRK